MTDREIWRIKKAVDYERFKPARRITRKIYMRKWRKRSAQVDITPLSEVAVASSGVKASKQC